MRKFWLIKCINTKLDSIQLATMQFVFNQTSYQINNNQKQQKEMTEENSMSSARLVQHFTCKFVCNRIQQFNYVLIFGL